MSTSLLQNIIKSQRGSFNNYVDINLAPADLYMDKNKHFSIPYPPHLDSLSRQQSGKSMKTISQYLHRVSAKQSSFFPQTKFLSKISFKLLNQTIDGKPYLQNRLCNSSTYQWFTIFCLILQIFLSTLNYQKYDK